MQSIITELLVVVGRLHATEGGAVTPISGLDTPTTGGRGVVIEDLKANIRPRSREYSLNTSGCEYSQIYDMCGVYKPRLFSKIRKLARIFASVGVANLKLSHILVLKIP